MEEKKETICALKTFSILKGDCLGYPPTVSDNIPLIGRGVSLSSNLDLALYVDALCCCDILSAFY